MQTVGVRTGPQATTTTRTQTGTQDGSGMRTQTDGVETTGGTHGLIILPRKTNPLTEPRTPTAQREMRKNFSGMAHTGEQATTMQKAKWNDRNVATLLQ